MRPGTKKSNIDYKLLQGGGSIRSRDKVQLNEPTPTGDAVKPDWLHTVPVAEDIWDEYMKMGFGSRVLTNWDSRMFALYCVMCAEIEISMNARQKGQLVTTPCPAWLAQYRMYAELFGLVPAGRTRIKERPQMSRPSETKTGTHNQTGSTVPQTAEGFFD